MTERRVQVTDRVRFKDGTAQGTVSRLLGTPRAGGGVHARVEWDNGASSVERLDLLAVIVVRCDWTGFRRELFTGNWVNVPYRCEGEGTVEHDWLHYCPKHYRAELRREARNG